MLKKVKNNFLIICFCVIILLPSAGGLFIVPDVSAENRGLTPFPEWSEVKALNAYEGYFTDRIAFRKQMIELSSFADYFLFNHSLVPHVIIGKHGQLFLMRKMGWLIPMRICRERAKSPKSGLMRLLTCRMKSNPLWMSETFTT